MAVVNTIKSGLGSKLSISTTAFTGTKDAAGLGAATYAQMTLEAFEPPGTSWDSATFTPLDTGITQYVKTKKNLPSFQVTIADLPTDSARTALEAANASLNSDWAFKADMVADGTTTGTLKYFTGKVMAFTPGGVNLDGVRLLTYTIQPTMEAVVVAAT